MSFMGIRAGLRDYFMPYSAVILPTRATVTRLTNYKGMWNVWQEYEIIISSRRLERDNIDLQLGNIEREIMKEMCQYKPGGIEGIEEIQYGGYQRIYDSKNWAKSNWASRTFIRCRYYHNANS
jgi:hypothetical protein